MADSWVVLVLYAIIFAILLPMIWYISYEVMFYIYYGKEYNTNTIPMVLSLELMGNTFITTLLIDLILSSIITPIVFLILTQ